MTRRERHIRILDWFGGLRSLTGSRTVSRELDHLLSKHGITLLTDEAVEMLAANCWRSYRRTQKTNRENRKIDAARRENARINMEVIFGVIDETEGRRA